jgi:ABC-2 type transport system permease protein
VIALAAFLRRAWLESTNALVPTAITLFSFALGLVSQLFLGRLVDAAPNDALGDYTGRYAAFLLLGLSLLDLQNTVVAGLSRRVRDAQLTGSLEALLVTPTPPALLLAGLALPDVLASLARVAIYLAVGVAWFGIDLSAVNAAGALLALALALAGFVALALFGAAITMFVRRQDPLQVLVAAASAVAGGVFYPRGVLPRLLAFAGDALPITPALDALRGAVLHGRGPSDADMARPLAQLAILVALLLPAAALLFGAALRRARVDGSLTTY